jgi:hypothetical protein
MHALFDVSDRKPILAYYEKFDDVHEKGSVALHAMRSVYLSDTSDSKVRFD